MDEAPQLPLHISPDGREIWDWAARFSEHTQRLDEIRRLRTDIAAIGRACGDCDHWMKSRECPRERNVNGRNHGPSMNDPRCGKFVEDRFASKRRVELQAKLKMLAERAYEREDSEP